MLEQWGIGNWSIFYREVKLTAEFGVLFVCLGNICRSPLAEGIFRHLVERRSLEHKYLIDSCGTGHWHVGEPPHKNSLLVAKKHGVSLEGQRARQICSNDFQMFDLIVAMDRQNQEDLFSWSHNSNARIICLREFDSAADNHDVPDPYYGGLEGFQSVYEILHRSCLALLEDLEKSK